MNKMPTPVVKIAKITSPGIFAPEVLEGASPFSSAFKLPKLGSYGEGVEHLGQLPFLTAEFGGDTFHTYSPNKAR